MTTVPEMSDLYRRLLDKLTATFGGQVDDANADAIAYAAAELYHRDFEPRLWQEKSTHDLLDMFGVPRAGVFAPYSLTERVLIFERRSTQAEYVNRAHELLTALGVPRQDETGTDQSLKWRLDRFLGTSQAETLLTGSEGDVVETVERVGEDDGRADEEGGAAKEDEVAAEGGEELADAAKTDEDVPEAEPDADEPAANAAGGELAAAVASEPAEVDDGAAVEVVEADREAAGDEAEAAEADGEAAGDEAEAAEADGEEDPAPVDTVEVGADEADAPEGEATGDDTDPSGADEAVEEDAAEPEDEASEDDEEEAAAADRAGEAEPELVGLDDWTAGKEHHLVDRDGDEADSGVDVDVAPGAAPLVDAVRALEHAARVEAELSQTGPPTAALSPGVDVGRLTDSIKSMQAELAALRTLVDSLGVDIRERLDVLHEEILVAQGRLGPATTPEAMRAADEVTRVLPPVAPAGSAEPEAADADRHRAGRRVLLVVILVVLGLVVAGVIVAGVVFGWDQIRSQVSGLVAP